MSQVQYPPGYDLHTDRGPCLVRIMAVMIALSGIALGLRLLARRLARMPLLWDDWLILLETPFAWIPSIQMIHASAHYGLGQHLALVASGNPQGFQDKIKHFWLNLYIAEIIYPISVTLIKVSILCFLYRIFHVSTFKKFSTALGVIVTAWGLATALTAIFSCHPVPAYWSPQDYPNHQCINTLQYFLGQVIPNLLLDVLIMLLPLHWLLGLRITLPQKLALSGVFGVGGFVTVVGALRLATIAQHQGTEDFTYNFVDLGVWTALETNVGVICACLPSFGPLFKACSKRGQKSCGSGSRVKHQRGSSATTSSPSHSDIGDEKAREGKLAWVERIWSRRRKGGEENLGLSQDVVDLEGGNVETGPPMPAKNAARGEKAGSIQKATEITVWNRPMDEMHIYQCGRGKSEKREKGWLRS
ncbi:uncharacterized protein KY384_000345 [Bacidia gigantensis]|uniref:uncharacterized protein n=1 Tax=Bacidia gigantensis TaxID=2732470 RepID=UPI001D04B94E|nr:uncharacterized protein KY384_000345 [Bacidia gigantensis]KAG8526352.1 hypothetical protein KY384_000345 [Bacidia gigantensis]